MSDGYQDHWPVCATEGCEQRIYYQTEARTHCRKCELEGLAPRTELPPLP